MHTGSLRYDKITRYHFLSLTRNITKANQSERKFFIGYVVCLQPSKDYSMISILLLSTEVLSKTIENKHKLKKNFKNLLSYKVNYVRA